MSKQRPLAYVIEAPKPGVVGVSSERPLRVGEYVILECEREVLGLVFESRSMDRRVEGMMPIYESVMETFERSRSDRMVANLSSVRLISWLDDIKNGRMNAPKVPPVPGTRVRSANLRDLELIFSPSRKGYVIVGESLYVSGLNVKVNVNKVVSRHLAILAKTGAGKSNLLALLLKKLREFNATAIVFDYHGDYIGIEGFDAVHPRINPLKLDIEEFRQLIDVPDNATRQIQLLSDAMQGIQGRGFKDVDEFWDNLLDSIRSHSSPALEGLSIRIRMARRRLRDLIDPNAATLPTYLNQFRINVVDLTCLTDRQADILISKVLDDVLTDRKKALSSSWDEKLHFTAPVVCAIEEAHRFVPASVKGGRTIMTRTKDAASKIAREGRKFGVGLIIVSQRPSKLDQDVLSQMGSLASLRITHPRDQNYIVESTEHVSEGEAMSLPTLNTGEAMFFGEWVPIPVAVKVELVKEKAIGQDIDAVDEWAHQSAGYSIDESELEDGV